MNAVEYYLSLGQYDERYWRDVRFLKKIVSNFAKKHYNFDTNINVLENGRLGRALGRHIRRAGKSYCIDMNKKFLENATKREIVDVIIHEAIHHILFSLGQPFKDGQPNFERALKLHGASSTRTLNPKMEQEVYVCSCCSKIVAAMSRKSNVITTRKISGCCRKKILYAGKKVV